MNLPEIGHINLAKGFRGGERQTAILIEELSKLNYSQTLFVRKNNSGLKDYIEAKNIKNLKIVSISKPYFFSIGKFRNLDLIHSHETKANQLSYLIFKFLKIPYLITRRVQFTPSNNIFNNLIYKNAFSVVALSKAIKNDLQKLSEDFPIEIIPSSFMNSHKIEFEKLNFEKKIVGHIGAVVDEHKGQCEILKLAKEFNNFQFIFIGDGKDLEHCKKISENLENVKFLGYLENPQRFIPNFDIFLFPSKHEGLGSTLLDVMRLKVPIIASNVGGIPDLIEDNENGFLINNFEEMRNKFQIISENKEVSDKFIENSFEKVKNFSPEMMASRYQKLYLIYQDN